MKCEPQLQEQPAIEILLKNIHGPVAFLLKSFTIKTFERLLNKASSLQEEASQLSFLVDQSSSDPKKLKPKKVFEKKYGIVSDVDKGKQLMKVQAERSSPQFYNQLYQRPQYLPPQHPPLQIQPEFNQQQPYLIPKERKEKWEKFNEMIGKTYPFKEAFKKILKNILKQPDFKLPAPKRLEEVGKSD
ncbi:hypothetical protein MA16_Dca015171 [Dendrobium catenatum]|uniref:Uncharacterized protein n=1 Tax=Dendrobium catenatum TaxID=906689 RepID=A0A2I0XAL7_9ASPA|nr:hypothetical protein MA16_Dca015171 [Dendrobium catenatum]